LVGSGACGIVFMAGAAAHADTSIGTSLSTTVDTVTTTTDAVTTTTDAVTTTTDAVTTTTEAVTKAADDVTRDATSATDDVVRDVDTTVDRAVDTVDKTLDDTAGTVGKVVDTAGETLHETVDTVGRMVDDAVGTVRGTTDDVVDTVDKTVGGIRTEPVTHLVIDSAGAPGAIGSDGRPAPAADVRTSYRDGLADRLDAMRARILAITAERLTVFVSTISGGSVSAAGPPEGSSPPAQPPPFPTGRSAPALPLDPAVTAFALGLLGVLVLRSTSARPNGWWRHLPATTPFHGAAVALAVERPG
jgi:hypothetical protein